MIDRLKTEEKAAKTAPSCTLVIFGITGDLGHRLLMPALYNLARWKRLPADFAIVGVGRSEISAEQLRNDFAGVAAIHSSQKRRSPAQSFRPERLGKCHSSVGLRQGSRRRSRDLSESVSMPRQRGSTRSAELAADLNLNGIRDVQ